jgi:predicted nucleic acid-binding protein
MVSLFFFDSSAIVKRYRTEIGSRWVRALTDPTAAHTLILSEITLAEVAAALAAMQRASRGITRRKRDRALNLFLGHCGTEYNLIAVSRSIIDRAVDLTQNHKLRGYDAVQLASALTLNESLIAAGATPLTFVSADNDQLAAANGAGLTTENPNLYP